MGKHLRDALKRIVGTIWGNIRQDSIRQGRFTLWSKVDLHCGRMCDFTLWSYANFTLWSLVRFYIVVAHKMRLCIFCYKKKLLNF